MKIGWLILSMQFLQWVKKVIPGSSLVWSKRIERQLWVKHRKLIQQQGFVRLWFKKGSLWQVGGLELDPRTSRHLPAWFQSLGGTRGVMSGNLCWDAGTPMLGRIAIRDGEMLFCGPIEDVYLIWCRRYRKASS